MFTTYFTVTLKMTAGEKIERQVERLQVVILHTLAREGGGGGG
jgi:hypothetical protein